MAGTVAYSGNSAGWLYTVKPEEKRWSSGGYRITASNTGLIPEVGQVYVRSNATNEQAAGEGISEVDSTLLDLLNNPSDGRYVEYTTQAASTAGYRHAWRIAVAEEVLIQPGNVTIYMGGSGYEGTITTGGSAEDSGFPEPGFLVTLPETLEEKLKADGKDVTALTLQYKEDGQTVSVEWGFEKYGAGDHNVYRIKPVGTTPLTKVRMTFTTSDGTTVDSDEFAFDKYIYQELEMKVYGSGIEEGKVKAIYDGRAYDIATDTATLTVRGASDAPDEEQYGVAVVQNDAVTLDAVDDALEKIGKSKSGAIVRTDTVYTINGSNVQTGKDAEIALLFDNILETDGSSNTNTGLLIDKAEEVLNWAGEENVQYEARYLDLVERDNGNAWVAASTPITVCWPLPEGTTKDTPFELLHFQGLHREMGTNMIEEKIDTCTVEKVPITVTDTHVLFTVQPYQNEGGIVSGGFLCPGCAGQSGKDRGPDREQGRDGQRRREEPRVALHRDVERYRRQRDLRRHDVCQRRCNLRAQGWRKRDGHGASRERVLCGIRDRGKCRRLRHDQHRRDGHHPRRRRGYGGVHQLSARNVPWWRKRPERSANRQFQQGRTLGAAVRSLADGADRYLQALLPRKAVPEIRSVPPRRQSGRRGGAASEACRQTH